MTIVTYATGTTTTDGTEQFLSSPNVAGKFQLQTDLNAMATGNALVFTAYQMAIAGGTTRKLWTYTLYGAQPANALIVLSAWIANSLTDTNAVRFSIQLTFGSNIAIPWKVVNDDATADTVKWNGTAVASPATAGIPDVNAKNVNNVAATSVTTINANLGTTQPQNFTGTGASALVKVDVTDIATAAVATGSAQLGVNVVNIAGGASQGAAGYVGTDQSKIASPTTTVDLSGTTIKNVDNAIANVTLVATTTNLTNPPTGPTAANVTQWSGGTVPAPGVTGVPIVDIKYLLGTIFTEGAAGRLAAGIIKFFNIASPAATMDHGILTDTVTTTTTATTATNLTNAPTAGDFNATMKTSLNAATPAVTVSDKTGFGLVDGAITAAKFGTDAIDANALKADAVMEIQTGLATAASIAALNNLSQANIRSAVGLATANLDTQLDAMPTNAELATALAGADDATLAAITALHNFDPATTNVTLSAAQAATLADIILRRSMAHIEASLDGDTLTDRSLYGAAAALANKVSKSGSTVTTYRSDDTTALATWALATDSGADPIVGKDPA